jgi:hemolysin D
MHRVKRAVFLVVFLTVLAGRERKDTVIRWIKRIVLFAVILAALFVPDVSASSCAIPSSITEVLAQSAGFALITLAIMLAGLVLWRAGLRRMLSRMKAMPWIVRLVPLAGIMAAVLVPDFTIPPSVTEFLAQCAGLTVIALAIALAGLALWRAGLEPIFHRVQAMPRTMRLIPLMGVLIALSIPELSVSMLWNFFSAVLAFLLRPAGLTLIAFAILSAGVTVFRARILEAFRTISAKATESSSTSVSFLRMDDVDREFLPAAIELLETPPSPVSIAAIWVICGIFTAALAWSYFGWLEIYAVAQGRIQPSGRSKVLQSLDPGKVATIAVANGTRVGVGDLLIELDARETAADQEEQKRDLESALAEVARRRAAIDTARSGAKELPKVIYPAGTSQDIQARENAVLVADLSQLLSSRATLLAQRAERLATCDRLKASIAAREKLIAVDKEHVDMRETLNQTKAASRAQVIETIQQYQAQVTTQAGEKGQLAENEVALFTLDRKLDETTSQFIADQTQKLVESARKADRFKGEFVKANTKHERTRLTAPISGTVQQLAITTVGQVVSPGQPLMTIVPYDAPIEIEALIQNQDIGFVQPGQPAVVKIESFPFTRYGTVDGIVLQVSRDAVDEREAELLSDPKSGGRTQFTTASRDLSKNQNLVFPATIALAKKSINVDGKDIPLSPGMAVTVEVLTGHRRALDYVLSPLREVASSSAHER